MPSLFLALCSLAALCMLPVTAQRDTAPQWLRSPIISNYKNNVYLYGGFSYGANATSNPGTVGSPEFWKFDVEAKTWTLISRTGTSIPIAAAYYPSGGIIGDAFYLFHNADSGAIWQYSFVEPLGWSRFTPKGPAPSPTAQGSSYFVWNGALVVTGGGSPSAFTNQTFLYYPPPRNEWVLGGRLYANALYSTAAYNPTTSLAVMAGGFYKVGNGGASRDTAPAIGSVAAFSTEGQTWPKVTVNGVVPERRDSPCLFALADRFVLYGGYLTSNANVNDMSLATAYTDLYVLYQDASGSWYWMNKSDKQKADDSAAFPIPGFRPPQCTVIGSTMYAVGLYAPPDRATSLYNAGKVMAALDLETLTWFDPTVSSKAVNGGTGKMSDWLGTSPANNPSTNSTDPNNNNNNNTGTGGLSQGAIIGIGVAGGVIVLGAVAAGVILFLRKGKRRSAPQSSFVVNKNIGGSNQSSAPGSLAGSAATFQNPVQSFQPTPQFAPFTPDFVAPPPPIESPGQQFVIPPRSNEYTLIDPNGQRYTLTTAVPIIPQGGTPMMQNALVPGGIPMLSPQMQQMGTPSMVPASQPPVSWSAAQATQGTMTSVHTTQSAGIPSYYGGPFAPDGGVAPGNDNIGLLDGAAAGAGVAAGAALDESVAPQQAQKKVLVQVLRAYNPNLDDELQLGMGDLVDVIESYPDHWAKGTNRTTGVTGFFPLSLTVQLAPSLNA
ncbi:hypothetical protein BJ742DRAFT_153962 [Cladochytrium replicatum]|nr:hypothetical protein BJ742DRAFT_153962 [Cladochytrium replicatum]